MREHRVLVCGGRDFTDRAKLYKVLDALDPKPTLVIQGGARGADNLAKTWAHDHNIPGLEFRAQWRMYGKAAGRLRNREMLLEGRPNLCVAFPTGGPGTVNMIAQAKAAGIPILVF